MTDTDSRTRETATRGTVTRETVTRSTATRPGPTGAEPSWDDALPVEIASLERALTTASHAFDHIERMTMNHRVRVVNDITGAVPDAASIAARAGHAEWAALIVVRAAREQRPAWSALCSRWDSMIVATLDTIATVGSMVAAV